MTSKTENRHCPRHSDMMIKICGMKDADNVGEIAYLTPMLMGFIFYRKSPRYAGTLDPSVVKGLPEFTRPVGVFVDSSAEEIEEICGRYGIGIVQLHGSETPEFCLKLRDKGFVVFKAFGILAREDFGRVKEYEGKVTMFVFDTQTASYGGSGKKFDWSVLADYSLSTPYLLSGGIGPDDVDNIIDAMRPGMAGIDINSGFEDRPGKKNLKKLIDFILSLRKYNETEPTSIPFWEKGG